ncbi:MAG: hypothetical protein WCT03_05750 [Candidatus Obscuribacterales bacterium]|jgi:hypothetical protein
MAERATISSEQLEVVKRLVTLLNEHKVPYQFTGGLAGNIHGSKWPLHDIDLEMPRAHIELVAYLLRQHIVTPLRFYQDDEFQLVMLDLKIDEIEVDINQIEAQQICHKGQWVPHVVDIKKAQLMPFHGLKVSVQPLDQLIAYKTILGRDKDVADLSKLLIL